MPRGPLPGLNYSSEPPGKAKPTTNKTWNIYNGKIDFIGAIHINLQCGFTQELSICLVAQNLTGCL